jgi:hypothetical protein
MSKSNTLVIFGFALTLAAGALSFAGPASAQTGAYTDPSRNVRASLEREHMVLSHPYAVRQPSAADRAARTAGSSYASDAPVYSVGKDLSILSQH